MVIDSVKKQATTSIPSYAVMPKDSFIFGIQVGKTLIMPHYMGQVSIYLPVFSLKSDVEGSNCQVILELLVFRIINCPVRSVVPEPTILETIMSIST